MTQNPAFYMSLLVDVFIYLKGRVTERERENLILWFTSLMAALPTSQEACD